MITDMGCQAREEGYKRIQKDQKVDLSKDDGDGGDGGGGGGAVVVVSGIFFVAAPCTQRRGPVQHQDSQKVGHLKQVICILDGFCLL